MAQISLLDAFNDCMERIASGQSLESCLSLYPGYAAQLRPLIEVALSVHQLQPPTAELREDQALVWEQITRTLPLPVRRRRRSYYRLLLLAAALLFILMLSATWFLFTRPDLPSDDRQILETLTPTASPSPAVIPSTFTLTPSPTLTVTTAPTLTPTSTTTVTVTVSPSTTASSTPTQTAALTATSAPTTAPTSTFAPGCGAPLTQQDAANRVMAIYPNTTISSITQVVKFGGTLVWEIKTSHGIEVNIDVACGVILTIQQLNPPSTSGTNSGVNNNNSGGAPSGSSGGQSSSQPSNSNDNDDDDDNDDNSGSGGGDDNDDDD